MMGININKTDKYIRMLLGIVILILGVAYHSWLGIAGAVLVLTALINWCPIYAIFGINTFRPKSSNKHGN
ncbi:MAG: DUF2892 domain-containing protein [Bacteroidota bacterium]